MGKTNLSRSPKMDHTRASMTERRPRQQALSPPQLQAISAAVAHAVTDVLQQPSLPQDEGSTSSTPRRARLERARVWVVLRLTKLSVGSCGGSLVDFNSTSLFGSMIHVICSQNDDSALEHASL